MAVLQYQGYRGIYFITRLCIKSNYIVYQKYYNIVVNIVPNVIFMYRVVGNWPIYVLCGVVVLIKMSSGTLAMLADACNGCGVVCIPISHIYMYICIGTRGACYMSCAHVRGVCRVHTYWGVCRVHTYRGVCRVHTLGVGVCRVHTLGVRVCRVHTYGVGVCRVHTYSGVCRVHT